MKGNTIRDFDYTPAGTEATGLLNYNAGTVTVSGNTFVGTEVGIDGPVTANVTGHSIKTIRPHGVRIDLFSSAKPAAETDRSAPSSTGRSRSTAGVTFHIKQGFGDHDVVRQHFATGSGRHVVKVLKNNVVVRSFVVRF